MTIHRNLSVEVNARTLDLPEGVGTVPEHVRTRRRGNKFRVRTRIVPDNADLVTWLDNSTPGWACVLIGDDQDDLDANGWPTPIRKLQFMSDRQAALYKLFWK